MRGLVLAAAMAVTAASAHAADMPDFLRGTLPSDPTPTRNWDGWYVGGQVGYDTAQMDYSNSLGGVANDIFRNTTLQSTASSMNVLGKANGQGTGFGGFVGRNFQYDDIVLGVEANYNYLSNLASSVSASEGPIQVAEPGVFVGTGDTVVDNVSMTGRASLTMQDELTFRGRAGWAYGNFLPYVFGGIAIAREDVALSVTPSVYRVITGPDANAFYLPQFASTVTEGRTNNFVVGWTAGLGMEYMLWGNLFLRGEWEYAKFSKVENIAATLNNARVGIGYKF
jgi:opacity protein-like surface antigen